MVVEDEADENGSKGVTIPAETDQLYTFKLYVVLTITNQDRLEVSISAAGIATIGAIHDAIKEHNEDPEAHPGLMDEAIGAHDADTDAHPALTARVRAAELALNGKESVADVDIGVAAQRVGGQPLLDGQAPAAGADVRPVSLHLGKLVHSPLCCGGGGHVLGKLLVVHIHSPFLASAAAASSGAGSNPKSL